MLINQNSIFTYPVLADFTDNYKTGEFIAEREFCSYGDDYIFKFHCKLRNNDDISSLLKENKCQYACLVECSATKFRKLFLSSLPNIEIKLQKETLCRRVEFSINIITTEDIKGFGAKTLAEDWQGRTYDLDKGAFLAVGPQLHKYFPELNDENNVASNSYIYIQKSTQKNMSVSWDHNKILINLNKENYCTYEKLKSNKVKLKIMIQMVVVPSLIELLDKIYNESDVVEEDRPNETDWYKYLNEKCTQSFEQDLKDYLEDNGSKLELVQKILEDPLSVAFTSLENISCTDEEGEEI